MKGTKVLGILAVVAILVLTAILITNNSKKNTEITEPQPTPKIENEKIKPEEITKVAEETTKVVEEAPAIREEVPSVIEETLPLEPRIEATHAAIVTVYPRLPEEGPSPCVDGRTGGGMFVTVVVEEGTELCDMSKAQVNKLASVGGYAKERLCECINEFCGEKPKPDKFVECLENPNRAL